MVCRYFGFTADWENWGENDRMSEGWGAGKGKENRLPAEAVKFKNAHQLISLDRFSGSET